MLKEDLYVYLFFALQNQWIRAIILFLLLKYRHAPLCENTSKMTISTAHYIAWRQYLFFKKRYIFYMYT